MVQPGRKYSAGSGYRYGFNGKENDKDAGEGIQDYGMRIYSERLGRFFTEDPLSENYPYLSVYQFAGNKPINSIDIDGLEPGTLLGFSNTPWTSGFTRVAPFLSTSEPIIEVATKTALERPTSGSSGVRWMEFGRNVHKENLGKWSTEEGFSKEVYLSKSSRADGIKIENIDGKTKGFIRELKPNSSWGRSAGVKQLQRYLVEAAKKFPDVDHWVPELHLYSTGGLVGMTYTTVAGDNLTTIANRFGVTANQIQILNNIQNPDELSVGETFLITIGEKIPELNKIKLQTPTLDNSADNQWKLKTQIQERMALTPKGELKKQHAEWKKRFNEGERKRKEREKQELQRWKAEQKGLLPDPA